MRHIKRGGTPHFRVAEPEWEDPLDPSYSAETGGRWNPHGAFRVLYLCASRAVARANVARLLDGQPFGPEDFANGAGPVLVEVRPPQASYVDAVTSRGLASLGLPETYPVHRNGRRVSWSTCQPLGMSAWEQGERGIACRSAALRRQAAGEELALFDRGRRPRAIATQAFHEWFWPDER